MAKSDFRARPIYHRKQDSIQAHLTIVMAAIACGHLLEQRTGKSIKRLVRTLKKYRTIEIEVNGQKFYAQPPLPPEVDQLIQRLPKPD